MLPRRRIRNSAVVIHPQVLAMLVEKEMVTKIMKVTATRRKFMGMGSSDNVTADERLWEKRLMRQFMLVTI